MSRCRFVEAESSRFPVTKLCRIAEVSRAAYYDWKERPTSEREQADAALTAKIRAIHAASGGQYGVPRVSRSCVRKAMTSAASAWRA